MLHEPIDFDDAAAADDLLERYARGLADAVESAGRDRAREAVDGDVLDAIAAGRVADLDLADAAAVFALADDAPDADTIVEEARSQLLLGMSSAMLNVDRIAAGIEGDFDPGEIQAKVEDRMAMTLGEYARLRAYIAGRG